VLQVLQPIFDPTFSDHSVEAFRARRLSAEYPYVWLDATYPKVRIDGRVVSQATVVAIGVTTDGERQVLSVDLGPSEELTACCRRPSEQRRSTPCRSPISRAACFRDRCTTSSICLLLTRRLWTILRRVPRRARARRCD
jgi:hypothetical protein